jgi:hypothetical protein
MHLSKIEFCMVLAAGVLGWLAYVFAGFVAVGVVGLLIGFIAVRMDLEKEVSVGMTFSGNLYVERTTAHQSMDQSLRAAYQAEIRSLMRALRIAKTVGAILIILGFGGLILIG